MLTNPNRYGPTESPQSPTRTAWSEEHLQEVPLRRSRRKRVAIVCAYLKPILDDP